MLHRRVFFNLHFMKNIFYLSTFFAKVIPEKALAIPRFVEKKTSLNKSYFFSILAH